MTAPEPSDTGATVVITHRVRPAMQVAYDAWLDEIGAACRAAPGFLDLQILRPIPELSASYTVVIRFATPEHIRAWIGSADRQRLIGQARPFLATDDAYAIHSGLDFWFMPQGAGTPVPVRWKQFLVTWSAIYPLAVMAPMVLVPGLRRLGLTHPAVIALPVTATIVALMVYVVMPRYTTLVRRWLFA
jgi:uncharacterized protein